MVSCTLEPQHCQETLIHLREHFSSLRVVSVPPDDRVALMRSLQSAAAFVCLGDRCLADFAVFLPSNSALIVWKRPPIHLGDIGRPDLSFLWVPPRVKCNRLVAVLESCEILTNPWMSTEGSNRTRLCDHYVLGNTVQAALEDVVAARISSLQGREDRCSTLDLMVVKQNRYTLHNTHYLLVPWLLQQLQATSFLEIGCQANKLQEALLAHEIPNLRYIGVDPKEGRNRRMTPDEFFASKNQTFRLIFIDGDHTAEQVYRDIENALFWLEPGGIILLHDCFPISLLWNSATFSGDGWKALLAHRLRVEAEENPLDAVGNLDFGIRAIVRRPSRQNVVLKLSAPVKEALLCQPPDFSQVDYRTLEHAASQSELLNLKNIPAFLRFLLAS